jgi:hypothetical protein
MKYETQETFVAFMADEIELALERAEENVEAFCARIFTEPIPTEVRAVVLAQARLNLYARRREQLTPWARVLLRPFVESGRTPQ